ncbi:hypothetical protein HR12_00215 [Microbacterium sp. SUBG005]|nr:hypothetical protein HR12_00215 [Microbacterium sp. SUBG005]
MTRRQRPVGAVLSAIAAVILAAPTLVFPADSPTEPKLVFLAVGSLVFVGAVVRVRTEKTDHRAAPPTETVTEE